MSKLPSIRTIPAPAWQRDRLDRWLLEWQIDRALVDSEDEPASDLEYPQAEDTPAAEVAPFSAEPAVSTGQVRLFSPRVCSPDTRPVYFAVLGREEGGFLLAPYGRFSEPAIPGELLTGREAMPLRVLCLWNARKLPVETASESWFIDDLSENEMREATAVLGHAGRGDELPEGIRERVGPPLQHPLDPRIDYLEEESEIIRTPEDEESGEDSPAGTDRLQYLRPETLPLAAEPREKYETAVVYRLPEKDVTLRIRIKGEEADLSVEDPQGRLSQLLDGWCVESADGRRSDPITSAKLILPAALARTAFLVVAPDGTRLSPTRA